MVQVRKQFKKSVTNHSIFRRCFDVTAFNLMTINILLRRRWSAGDGVASDSVMFIREQESGPFENV